MILTFVSHFLLRPPLELTSVFIMVEKYVVIEKGKPIDKEKKVTMNARLTVINNVIDYKKETEI